MTIPTTDDQARPEPDLFAGQASAHEGSPDSDPGEPFVRVLADDIGALAGDALNYVDAEFAFQKTRARFVGNRAVTALAFGVVAVVLALLAAIGLTVGLIIALTPLVTAWGATAIVVGLLLLVAYLCVRRAQGAAGAIGAAFAGDGPAEEKHDV